MQKNVDRATPTQRRMTTRIPIALDDEEAAILERLAHIEQRSKAGMARIIYLDGLKQFKEKAGAVDGR